MADTREWHYIPEEQYITYYTNKDGEKVAIYSNQAIPQCGICLATLDIQRTKLEDGKKYMMIEKCKVHKK